MFYKACRRHTFFLSALLLCFAFVRAQSAAGYLQIIADPNVNVFIDGKLAGRTSVSEQGIVLIGIAAGKHQLRFEKDGFKPRRIELIVSAGEIEVYRLYSLTPNIGIQEEDVERTGYMEPETGTLEISCLPVYCSISIPSLGLENYEKKSSALVLQDALATRHQITIRVGDERLQEIVNLQPDTKLRLFADFSGSKPRLTTLFKPEVRRVQLPKPEVQTLPTYELALERPLAVIIDNTDAAYPQLGLVEASSIFEMPVEGGVTHLMGLYNRTDPAQFGPVRGARDYFLEAALAMNATLVHDGGSPSALARIASQNLMTIDALQGGSLFAQAPDRAAPHNVFTTGAALRDAVGHIQTRFSGALYTPPADTPDVFTVSVNYSFDYTSAFHYLPEIDQYRWVRNGTEATDAAQTAVTTDVVVVARVIAFPYPDDPEGRLYLPYSGGEATLFMRGKVVSGSWTPEGGLTFISSVGNAVDLTPFKSWILFAPEEAKVSAQ